MGFTFYATIRRDKGPYVMISQEGERVYKLRNHKKAGGFTCYVIRIGGWGSHVSSKILLILNPTPPPAATLLQGLTANVLCE